MYMSEDISVSLQARTVTGKAVKRLRHDGIVPAVIHDHGKESVVVQGDFVELTKAYHSAGKHHPVNLTADSKKYLALIKTATFDPKKNQLTHIVFNAVKANQTVDAEIPVHVQLAEGNDATPAERSGFVVLAQLTEVQIEALPKDLPDVIYYDGEKLVAVGDQLTVADLIVPKGVTLKTELEHVIATVFEPSALAASNDAAGGDTEDTDATVAETAEAEGEAPAAETADKKEDK
jgi:large subunit ribosomal protein L25